MFFSDFIKTTFCCSSVFQQLSNTPVVRTIRQPAYLTTNDVERRPAPRTLHVTPHFCPATNSLHFRLPDFPRIPHPAFYTTPGITDVHTHGQLCKPCGQFHRIRVRVTEGQLAGPAACIYLKCVHTALRARLAVCIASVMELTSALPGSLRVQGYDFILQKYCAVTPSRYITHSTSIFRNFALYPYPLGEL